MSVSIQEVGRLANGSRLTNEEDANSVYLPFNVLWDQARSGIVKLVHFSFDNVHEVLAGADVRLSSAAEAAEDGAVDAKRLTLNSKLVSASFGRTRRRVQFPDKVEVRLEHLAAVGAAAPPPTCVSWSPDLAAWTDSGCSLLETSAAVTTCACDHMSLYALLADPTVVGSGSTAARGSGSSFSIVTLQIVTYIVAAISVVCVVLILVKVGPTLFFFQSTTRGMTLKMNHSK